MAKKKVQLTEEQKRKNADILAQIEAERARLINDTRRLQEDWANRKRRRRRHQEVFSM
jgi:hypothetical protein